MLRNDFSKLCRSCMRNGEFNVFSTLFDAQPIAKLLQQLVTEQISPTDQLPILICDQCLNLVISHYLFYQNYQRVQVRLRKIFEEDIIEEKPTLPHISDSINSGISNNCNSDNDVDPLSLEDCKQEEAVFSTVIDLELNHNESQSETQNVRSPNYELSELPPKDDSNEVDSSSDDRERQNIDNKSTGEFVNQVEIYYVSSEESESANSIPHTTNDSQRSIKNDIDKTSGKKNVKYSTNRFKEAMHACSECSHSFQFVKDLRQHCKDTGHEYPRTHTCEICQKKFTSNSYLINEHMKLHSEERPFVCEECGMSFSLEAYLNTHKKIVHGNREPFICEFCGKEYRKKHSLDVHLRKHKGETPFKCDCCGKSFYRKYSLMYHLYMHHGKDNEAIRQNLQTRQCKICGKKLSRSGFYSHMKIRHGEKSTCTICGKTLKSKAALDLHMDTHNRSKHHKCEICPKSFLHLTSLKTHMLVHTGERPYCCDRCGAGFRQRSALNIHQRTHTGVKPYSCTFCNKRFAFKGNMTGHMRIHTDLHMDTHNKSKHHKCEICPKSFLHLASLKSHMLVHTGEKPYRCDECGVGFRQSSHLRTHKKTHTGEKNYSCTFCKKRFALKGNMTVHMRIHTGETTHHCSICNKGFHDSGPKKRHETKCHKLHSHKEDDYSGTEKGKEKPSSRKVFVENIDQSIEESNSSN